MADSTIILNKGEDQLSGERGAINKAGKFFGLLAQLGKFRITLFVGFSTLTGYVLRVHQVDLSIFFTIIGVTLLAAGSSTLNHIQESELDSLMDRTRKRPIPAGNVSPGAASIIALLFIASGAGLIFAFGGMVPMLLGFTALVWYNAIYTPMKRKFALAVIPGSVIGAIPPVIGWTAAGGALLDTSNLLVALFFFVWQIPHFWLLLLIYSKDYEKAGFPTLTEIFSEAQVSRITFIWIAALVFLGILIAAFASVFSQPAMWGMTAIGIWLIVSARKLSYSELSKKQIRSAFVNINIYVLLMVLIVSIDKLI